MESPQKYPSATAERPHAGRLCCGVRSDTRSRTKSVRPGATTAATQPPGADHEPEPYPEPRSGPRPYDAGEMGGRGVESASFTGRRS